MVINIISVQYNGGLLPDIIPTTQIIQYTSSVLFTQAPIRVCLDGTNIDSRTILVTMHYCG